MKQYFLVIVLLVSFTVQGQTPSDSINANPNPFSQRTLVSYTLANNDTISIRVYNISGMLVVLLVNDSIVQAGAHQDSLRMDNFPDGIYIMSLFNRKKNLKNTRIVKSLGTGIHQQSTDNLNLTVYPNPGDGFYNVVLFADKPIDLCYQVFNVIGEEVKSGAFLSCSEKNIHELNLRDLKDGVYTLSVFDNTGLLLRQKLIKN